MATHLKLGIGARAKAEANATSGDPFEAFLVRAEPATSMAPKGWRLLGPTRDATLGERRVSIPSDWIHTLGGVALPEKIADESEWEREHLAAIADQPHVEPARVVAPAQPDVFSVAMDGRSPVNHGPPGPQGVAYQPLRRG